IASESINTNEAQRDTHLRSADFFDTATFPEIRFESTDIGKVQGTAFTVAGNLTIRGITRPIELEAAFEGSVKDPYGNDRIGLTVNGHLDPNDYGVDWNQELDSGGNMLGDRVDFTASISAVKAAEDRCASSGSPAASATPRTTVGSCAPRRSSRRTAWRSSSTTSVTC